VPNKKSLIVLLLLLLLLFQNIPKLSTFITILNAAPKDDKSFFSQFDGDSFHCTSSE
jgi:hypothetical protein